jgi:hypothetical protein
MAASHTTKRVCGFYRSAGKIKIYKALLVPLKTRGTAPQGPAKIISVSYIPNGDIRIVLLSG